MKLVLVADTFPPMRTSGAVQLRDLSREFVRQGHQLTVLLPSHDIGRAWELDTFEGAQVLRLKAPKVKDVGYVRRTVGELAMPYAMARNLAKSPLAKSKWEGIAWYSPSIFHAPLVTALKRQSGCKGYLIIRDIFPEWALDLGLMKAGVAYKFFKFIARKQYEVADIIGVQSPGNLSYFDDWDKQKSGRRLEVLQNWLSPPANAECSLKIESSPLAGRKILVYAGNMGVAQGLDVIVELAHRMRARRDIGFLFVGRGSEASRLEARSKDLNLDNVVFHSEIDPDEIPALYAQCSAGIVALDARHKSHNIPGKFLTYMQSGLPALAIVNQGNDLARLIREEQVGVVCESGDVSELEKLCSTLILLAGQDDNLTNRCTQLFEREFSVSNTVQQIISALQDEKFQAMYRS